MGMLQNNLPAIMAGVIVLTIVGGFVFRRVRAQRARSAFEELVAREAGWEETAEPVGLRDVGLGGIDPVLTTHGRGRVEYAMTGPLTVEIAGRQLACEASCFYWFYETESSGDDHGTRTQMPVAAIRLPGRVPTRISVRREDLVSRLGAKHQGERFGSEDFERRFRVTTDDGELAALLFDEGLQQLLVERFRGREIELFDDGLLVAGESDDRDETVSSSWIAELPAVRDDLRALVEHIPAPFWEAIGAAAPAPATDPAAGAEEADRATGDG